MLRELLIAGGTLTFCVLMVCLYWTISEFSKIKEAVARFAGRLRNKRDGILQSITYTWANTVARYGGYCVGIVITESLVAIAWIVTLIL